VTSPTRTNGAATNPTSAHRANTDTASSESSTLIPHANTQTRALIPMPEPRLAHQGRCDVARDPSDALQEAMAACVDLDQ
jgi:hypothetical protein